MALCLIEETWRWEVWNLWTEKEFCIQRCPILYSPSLFSHTCVTREKVRNLQKIMLFCRSDRKSVSNIHRLVATVSEFDNAGLSGRVPGKTLIGVL